MKRVPYYHFIVDSETPPGKRIRTRYVMSEEMARERGGNPVRIDSPVEWRDIPETEEERAAMPPQRGWR